MLATRPERTDPGQVVVRVGHFGGLETAEAVLRSYRQWRRCRWGDEASLAPDAVVDLAAEGLWVLEEHHGGSSGTSPV